MSCVSSTSISILFNGGKLEPFNPSRGIRQGDPLSPYLFILFMEYLGYLIKKECIEGSWVPSKASKRDVGISHIFFVDDLMLFAKVSKEESEVIKDVLDRICSETRQMVSSEKSRIYFSLNISDELKDKVYDSLGIEATSNLGKYLGFPVRHKGALSNQFNFVAERVISKLSGW